MRKLPRLAVPKAIDKALRAGADLALSLSGGKDSHALVNVLPPWFRAQGYPGHLYIIHADLGRAEWKETPAFVEHLAAEVGLPLVVVRRPKGDLIARFEERLESVKGTTTPFWPSPESRYCTAHNKSGPIDTALRNPVPFWPSSDSRYCASDQKRGPIDTHLRTAEVVVSAEGVRGAESRDRAKKPVLEIRKSITAKSTVTKSRNLAGMSPARALAAREPGKRVAFNWRPLFHWTEEEIWVACGTTLVELNRRRALYAAGQTAEALAGWPAHPAYVYGNERLSCAFCVMGSQNDLLNGAQHQPELYGHLIQLEILGQATFKHGWSLTELPVTGEAARVRDEILAQN